MRRPTEDAANLTDRPLPPLARLADLLLAARATGDRYGARLFDHQLTRALSGVSPLSRRHRAGCIRGERGRALRRGLAARDGAHCFYCPTRFPDPAGATLDHFIPWRLWPTNRPVNLVLTCRACNEHKAGRLPLTFVWLLLNTQQPAPTFARAA